MKSVKSTVGREKNRRNHDVNGLDVFTAVVDMEMISKNKKFFESLHLKYPSKCIASIDDYLYFIAAWKIYRLKNCIKFLDQDKADFLQKLADEAEPVVCSSRMDDALKFTNDNASEICDPNQIGFGMMNAIADFVTRFQDKELSKNKLLKIQ